MAKRTLEELNRLVATLAAQYKQTEIELADAFIATGDSPESQDQICRELAKKKAQLWKEYSKYKKLQIKAREQATSDPA